MFRILILSTAIVAGFGVASLAEAEGKRKLPDFAALDADSNGGVSTDELRAYRQTQAAERFAQVDTDADGLLTKAELETAAKGRRGQRIERMLARLDRNDDGAISLQEVRANPPAGRDGGDRMAQMFARADLDNSGELSAAEWQAAQDTMAPRKPRR